MLSVVIPVHNEAENIATLVTEIAALQGTVPLTDIIYVDDGSTDGTLDELKRVATAQPLVRIIKQFPRAGQSCATRAGVEAARGPVVVTLDGDGQNDPAGIVAMYMAFEERSRTTPRLMVAGQRQKREDSFIRKLSSRIANNVRGAMLKDGVRDTGCALKMFRREDYLSLPYFDHMHRFLAALMRREGVEVALVDVKHRQRTRGTSKYGIWNRLWVGIVDIIGVMWLQRRARPIDVKATEVRP